MGMELFVKTNLFQMKQHKSIFQELFGHSALMRRRCSVNDVQCYLQENNKTHVGIKNF